MWPIVSIPSTGLLPFLRLKKQEEPSMTLSVNALYGLTSISTGKYSVVDGTLNLCQCPLRAYFHFYSRCTVQMNQHQKCVNALYGLTSISTTSEGFDDDLIDVSMPSTGLLPFLQSQFHYITLAVRCVSMPSTGLLPFLLMKTQT